VRIVSFAAIAGTGKIHAITNNDLMAKLRIDPLIKGLYTTEVAPLELLKAMAELNLLEPNNA
jgi:hypothetical protein